MKQLTKQLTVPLAFAAAFLLFGAPGAPGASHLPSLGDAQAFGGCGGGRVSLACSSFCSAYERCITGGGAALCNEEMNALLTCINIPEVRVVGIRIVMRVPLALFRTSYSGYRLSWSDLWNSWYAQPPPPPPPKDETSIGKCFRPVDLLPPGTPPWISDFAAPRMPQHHDVRTRKVAGGATTETTRGFFAVNMGLAAFAAWRWFSDPENGGDGFVDAVVRDSATTAGSCNLSKVGVSTYDTVLGKITAPNNKRYHLLRYNCQHWAAEMSGR